MADVKQNQEVHALCTSDLMELNKQSVQIFIKKWGGSKKPQCQLTSEETVVPRKDILSVVRVAQSCEQEGSETIFDLVRMSFQLDNSLAFWQLLEHFPETVGRTQFVVKSRNESLLFVALKTKRYTFVRFMFDRLLLKHITFKLRNQDCLFSQILTDKQFLIAVCLLEQIRRDNELQPKPSVEKVLSRRREAFWSAFQSWYQEEPSFDRKVDVFLDVGKICRVPFHSLQIELIQHLNHPTKGNEAFKALAHYSIKEPVRIIDLMPFLSLNEWKVFFTKNRNVNGLDFFSYLVGGVVPASLIVENNRKKFEYLIDEELPFYFSKPAMESVIDQKWWEVVRSYPGKLAKEPYFWRYEEDEHGSRTTNAPIEYIQYCLANLGAGIDLEISCYNPLIWQWSHTTLPKLMRNKSLRIKFAIMNLPSDLNEQTARMFKTNIICNAHSLNYSKLMNDIMQRAEMEEQITLKLLRRVYPKTFEWDIEKAHPRQMEVFLNKFLPGTEWETEFQPSVKIDFPISRQLLDVLHVLYTLNWPVNVFVSYPRCEQDFKQLFTLESFEELKQSWIVEMLFSVCIHCAVLTRNAAWMEWLFQNEYCDWKSSMNECEKRLLLEFALECGNWAAVKILLLYGVDNTTTLIYTCENKLNFIHSMWWDQLMTCKLQWKNLEDNVCEFLTTIFPSTLSKEICKFLNLQGDETYYMDYVHDWAINLGIEQKDAETW